MRVKIFFYEPVQQGDNWAEVEFIEDAKPKLCEQCRTEHIIPEGAECLRVPRRDGCGSHE